MSNSSHSLPKASFLDLPKVETAAQELLLARRRRRKRLRTRQSEGRHEACSFTDF